jgi:hypothetical protein
MTEKHPFVGMRFKDLPFDKISRFHFGDEELVDGVRVYKSGTEDGHKWEYGALKVERQYEDFAFYAVDGQIKILDTPPGDYFGFTLFGDTLILVGHDGAVFHNVKTFERGEITT